jgi:hypothetical protein
MNHRWIGEARPKENPDQEPKRFEADHREDLELWAVTWRAIDYEVRIYPKPTEASGSTE